MVNIGVPEHSIDDWRYKEAAAPLKILDKIGLLKNENVLRDLRIKFGAKARNSIPALLPLNEDFGFILGLFLADGSMRYDDKDGKPKGIYYAFGSSSKDKKIIKSLINALLRLGIASNAISVTRVRGYYQVHVNSKIFSILLYEILEGKVKDKDRYVPLNIALRAPENFRRGLIKGFWVGDGSAFIDSSGHLRLVASVTNRKLAESLVVVMRSLGIIASIREVDNSRGFTSNSSIKRNIYFITVMGGLSKIKFAEILGLEKYLKDKRTYSKVKSNGIFTLHKVVEVKFIEKDSLLYDLEVPEGHVYAISGGLVITHNTTIHAEHIDAAVKRLTSPPMNIPQSYIPLINFAAAIKRVRLYNPDGTYRIARRVTEIWEVREYGDYQLIARWDPADRRHYVYFEDSIVLKSIADQLGRDFEWVLDEASRRALVLKWMAVKGVTRVDDVYRKISEYYARPNEVYEKAVRELSAEESFR